MPNFREKPREIEAKRFFGTEQDKLDVITWVKSKGYTWFDMFTPAPTNGVSIDRSTGFMLLVDSKGNLAAVESGDWVVVDPTGLIYPMKDESFHATFAEIVDGGPDAESDPNAGPFPESE